MLEQKDYLGIGEVNMMDIPPVSMVPSPDLSNLNAYRWGNPDDRQQTDMVSSAQENIQQPDLSNLERIDVPPPPKVDLSGLAQAEIPLQPLPLTEQSVNPIEPPSVLPSPIPLQDVGQNMTMQESRTPLFMSNKFSFDNSGGNIERMSRAWSLLKTPVFATVQENPVMRNTRITNKIGQVTSRNGMNVAATRLRLI